MIDLILVISLSTNVILGGIMVVRSRKAQGQSPALVREEQITLNSDVEGLI